MYSKFSTFSYKMGGMSSNNSDKFLSEKDLESMEFNFLVRPTLEFLDGSHVAHSEDGDNQAHDQDQEQVQKQVQVQEEVREEENIVHAEERELENCASLKIKIPSSLGEFKKNDDDDEEKEEEEEDGFRTPTSLDQRIPLIIPTCPPAPRKPKTLPSTKRKAPHHRKILLDMSYEIQSLFPSAILSDLGGKLKKARELGNCT